jgi:hypothetical protein
MIFPDRHLGCGIKAMKIGTDQLFGYHQKDCAIVTRQANFAARWLAIEIETLPLRAKEMSPHGKPWP